MAAQEVFKRYEKKFLLNQEQFSKLMAVLDDKMTLDQYGLHTINNIYFDTPNYELIRTSLDKPVYKEKLRLRSYGTPTKEDTVFIELKKKFDGVVYKRRTPMALWEAEDYLYRGIHPAKDTQIIRELDYFLQQYTLNPAVFLAYDRKAYFGNENPELRVTFDHNIRCRTNSLHLAQGSTGQPIIDECYTLMEVKIPGTMPFWMSRLFSELGLFSTSFSKYGTYYKQNYIALMQGGTHYA